MKNVPLGKLALFAILFGAGCVRAQEWVALNPNDPTMVVAIDASSVGVAGVYQKAWFRTTFAAALRNPGGKRYRSSIEQIYFDCSSRTQAAKVVHYYSEGDGKGDVADVWRPSSLTFLESPPGSIGAAQALIVCRRQ